jgi:hypothetical protein
MESIRASRSQEPRRRVFLRSTNATCVPPAAKNKWDTVPPSSTRISLKIKKSSLNQVGHALEVRKAALFGVAPAMRPPRQPAAARQGSQVDGKSSLGDQSGAPSKVPAHFYSTMRTSRNPYISMKTNDRCHFYSTMKPGGNDPLLARAEPPAGPHLPILKAYGRCDIGVSTVRSCRRRTP